MFRVRGRRQVAEFRFLVSRASELEFVFKGSVDLILGMAIEITSDLSKQTVHPICIDWKVPTTIKLPEKVLFSF